MKMEPFCKKGLHVPKAMSEAERAKSRKENVHVGGMLFISQVGMKQNRNTGSAEHRKPTGRV